jgi:hypothetical protein
MHFRKNPVTPLAAVVAGRRGHRNRVLAAGQGRVTSHG